MDDVEEYEDAYRVNISGVVPVNGLAIRVVVSWRRGEGLSVAWEPVKEGSDG